MSPATKDGQRLRLFLLAAGAGAGLLAAGAQLVSGTADDAVLPPDVVARVGGREIAADRLQQALADLAADRRGPLTTEDRAFVLQRLVDEELLLLHGLRAGLTDSLPEVRKALVAGVIAQTVAEAEAAPVTEEELRQLYRSEQAYFSQAARYRVRWLRTAGESPEDARRARQAADLLRQGGAPAAAAAASGLEYVDDLADAPLPLAKLRDYLGAELAAAVTALAPGAATEPLPADGRLHVLHLVDRQPARPIPFDLARDMVLAEHLRRLGDQALGRQLQRLREEYEVVTPPGGPGRPQ